MEPDGGAPPDVTANPAEAVRALVEECCPELRDRVAGWLACYKDPALLYASLWREYKEHGVGVPADAQGASSSSSSGAASSQPRCGRPSGAAAPADKRPRLYKVRLCEAFLLNQCRRGSNCTFAHGDQELEYWQASRGSGQQAHRQDPRPQPQQQQQRPSSVPRPLRSPRHSTLELLPSQIGFCHDTVAREFRNGMAILDTLRSLLRGETRLRDVQMMEVVMYQDKFFSMSNRRLCMYRMCQHLGAISTDTPVKVKLLDELPDTFLRKFTTPCNGDWVRVRQDGRICGRTFEDTSFGRELLS